MIIPNNGKNNPKAVKMLNNKDKFSQELKNNNLFVNNDIIPPTQVASPAISVSRNAINTLLSIKSFAFIIS